MRRTRSYKCLALKPRKRNIRRWQLTPNTPWWKAQIILFHLAHQRLYNPVTKEFTPTPLPTHPVSWNDVLYITKGRYKGRIGILGGYGGHDGKDNAKVHWQIVIDESGNYAILPTDAFEIVGDMPE